MSGPLSLFNAWWRRTFPGDDAACWAALEKLPGVHPRRARAADGNDGLCFGSIRADELQAARPRGVSDESWARTVTDMITAMSQAETIGKRPGQMDAGYYPLEGWTFAGLCSQGPRVYVPTREDWETLSRSEINIPVGEYRQPYETFCVVFPPDLFPEPVSNDLGFPVVSIIRHARDGGTTGVGIFGTSTVNLNIWRTWRSAGEKIQDRFNWFMDPQNYDPPDELYTLGASLAERESQFCNAAIRATFNACMLLTAYGCKSLGHANPERARKLEESLQKKTPENIRDANRRELAAIPQLYTCAQLVRLREYVRGEPGEPTGRHPRPHWRRGHWANVRCGSGRSQTRRVFRAEVFVGMGTVPTGPTVVGYTS